MNLIVLVSSLFVVILAMLVRADEPQNDEFDADDIVDLSDHIQVENLRCAENAVNEYTETLPPSSLEDIAAFKNTFPVDYDKYNRCHSLSKSIAIAACLEGLKQKFADYLNTLVDELTDIGIPHSLDLVIELKIKVESCIAA